MSTRLSSRLEARSIERHRDGIGAVFGLVVLALVLYASRLASAPGILRPDEAALARQAYAIASNGHDTEGHLLPLYFHVEGAVWLQAVPIYLTALFVKALPMTGSLVRWPSALVGAIDVALVYIVARKFFNDVRSALAAPLLLVATPAHFVYSRLAIDTVYPVVFVTAWLWCVVAFGQRGDARWLFASATCLGLGCFTQASAPLTMFVYLLITCSAVSMDRTRSVRNSTIAAAGFVLPLAVLGSWFLVHRDAYIETLGRWAVHPAYIRNPVAGVRAALGWETLTSRAELYWWLLNPSMLFLGRPTDGLGWTFPVGVFLSPVALLLPFGVRRIAKTLPTAQGFLLFAGALSAPLAASTFGERDAIARELVLLPFVVIVAAAGVADLLTMPKTLARAAAVVLAVVAVVQFCVFYRAYFLTAGGAA